MTHGFGNHILNNNGMKNCFSKSIIGRVGAFSLGLFPYFYIFLYQGVIQWCIQHPEYSTSSFKPPVGVIGCISNRFSFPSLSSIFGLIFLAFSIVLLRKKVSAKVILLLLCSLYVLYFVVFYTIFSIFSYG